MGCAPSSSADGRNRMVADEREELAQWSEEVLSNENPNELLAAYLEVEKMIAGAENRSPAATLGFALSRRQLIGDMIAAATENGIRTEGSKSSIHELLSDLGLRRSAEAAAEHEEFVAAVNRRELQTNLIAILERKLAETEETVRGASEEVARLQVLYEKQDMLLGRIYGQMYGSEKEKDLEEEVDKLRNYRDAFSGGVCLWEFAASDVTDASECAARAVNAWASVESRPNLAKKLSAAADARNGIQEAVLLVRMSQDSMPGVQFPYCTRREMTTVSQATEYAFTDIFIEDRHSHALKAYKNFQERAGALSLWMRRVLNSTLKKDVADIDGSINKISERLRLERIRIICEKSVAGAEGRQDKFFRGYDDFENPRNDFHAEFERKLAARRDAMWPSRRMEELRMQPLLHHSSLQ